MTLGDHSGTLLDGGGFKYPSYHTYSIEIYGIYSGNTDQLKNNTKNYEVPNSLSLTVALFTDGHLLNQLHHIISAARLRSSSLYLVNNIVDDSSPLLLVTARQQS